MAPGELINVSAPRYPAMQTATSEASSLRRRMPAVLGIMVALPISLLLWVALILGLRSLL